MSRGVPCPFFLLMATLPLIDRLRPGTPKFYPDRDRGRLHEEMMFERSPRAYWLTVDDLDHMSFADDAFSPSRLQRLSSFLGARLTAELVRGLTTRYAARSSATFSAAMPARQSLDGRPIPPRRCGGARRGLGRTRDRLAGQRGSTRSR